MAGPNVVYSTSADPDFYARKLQMLGGTIESLRQRSEQRRQQKEQMDRAEVQRFLSAAEGMPELAGTWGQEIKKKYGAKYPEVGPIIDAISKRAELPAMIESAGNDFSSRVNAMEQQRAQREQQIAEMPDTIDVPVPMPQYGPFGIVGQVLSPLGIQQQPITAPVPNVEKQRALAEHQSVDPAYIPFMASQEMPYEQRLAAGIWAKQRGSSIPAPSGFDPFGDDLPDDIKAQLAAQKGLLTGETGEAVTVRNKLKQSPARLQEQGYQQGERVARQEFSETERVARESNEEKAARRRLELEKERIEYQDRLARVRQDREFSNQSRLIDKRQRGEKEEDPVRDLGKLLGEDSRDAQESYDDELDQALTGLISPDDIEAAKSAFVAEHGARPSPISRVQARRIERHISDKIEAGEIDEADAEEEAANLVASYMAATGRGIPPGEAMAIALGEESAPETTPREAAREKVNKIRANGDVNKPEKPRQKAEVALQSAPAATPAVVDPDRVKAIIRKAHPNWTPAQIEKAASDYVAAKGGG